jgi:translation initiation factor 2B subunit (eIF-2B alpha/beta/delta family)
VHLQELENRVKSFAVTDNERNKLLITENTHLRKSLVQTRKRMASLISAITTMDDKLKVILEESQGTNENLDEGDSQQDVGLVQCR